MNTISERNIRYFRLRHHHLDASQKEADILEAAGACGLQNTPPGSWETALYNRAPGVPLDRMRDLLSREKTLLQAWSLRGAPLVFPTIQSGIFLSALIPEAGEEWIYTKGIGLALDHLGMGFDELLAGLVSVIPLLDHQIVKSKAALDRLLAEAMLPLIPSAKHDLWNSPSMYGAPDVQTVGGAAVSFLLRPCAMMGLVVFAERDGQSPGFTSRKAWAAEAMNPGAADSPALVRKYLRCFGPATARDFAAWLGCSMNQARRMWAGVAGEMMPVNSCGRTADILSEDLSLLLDPPAPEREWLLLGAHDPYLDLRDRKVIMPNQALQRKLWRTVANSGAIIYQGEAFGMWSAISRSGRLAFNMELWKNHPEARKELGLLAQGYAAFRKKDIAALNIKEA